MCYLHKSGVDKMGLPPWKCKTCIDRHLKYACIHKVVDQNLGQASYAMCLSSKLHFRVVWASVSIYVLHACQCVCVCAVSAITLTIQHTKESCFDDTSCRVCTIRLNSVCRCMRDRAKYFGNEYKKLHYFHLVNTAFIWPVNVSFFLFF